MKNFSRILTHITYIINNNFQLNNLILICTILNFLITLVYKYILKIIEVSLIDRKLSKSVNQISDELLDQGYVLLKDFF